MSSFINSLSFIQKIKKVVFNEDETIPLKEKNMERRVRVASKPLLKEIPLHHPLPTRQITLNVPETLSEMKMKLLIVEELLRKSSLNDVRRLCLEKDVQNLKEMIECMERSISNASPESNLLVDHL